MRVTSERWLSKGQEAKCVFSNLLCHDGCVCDCDMCQAFCAGGDVKHVVQSERVEERIEFFNHEYRMNYAVAKFRKPLICLMDGIVMGGGCGIAMHASFRIATER